MCPPTPHPQSKSAPTERSKSGAMQVDHIPQLSSATGYTEPYQVSALSIVQWRLADILCPLCLGVLCGGYSGTPL